MREEVFELIEFLSLDCTATKGEWHSDAEIKIDRNGNVILNNSQIKQFWDGKIRTDKPPLRLKSGIYVETRRCGEFILNIRRK